MHREEGGRVDRGSTVAKHAIVLWIMPQLKRRRRVWRTDVRARMAGLSAWCFSCLMQCLVHRVDVWRGRHILV